MSGLVEINNLESYYVFDSIQRNNADNALGTTLKDINSIGYENITFVGGKVKVLVLVLVAGSIKYSKSITIGSKYTYKHALETLVHHKCDILNIPYPDNINTKKGIDYIHSVCEYSDPSGVDVDKKIELAFPKEIAEALINRSKNRTRSEAINSGYTGVSIDINTSGNPFMWVSLRGGRNSRVINKENTYKDVLRWAVNRRCESYGLAMPDELDYSIGLKWLSENGFKAAVDNHYKYILVDKVSTTGYANIIFSNTPKRIQLVCLFTHNSIVYEKRLDLAKISFRKAIYALLKFKCKVIKYKMISNVDYIKGMDTYLSILNLNNATKQCY
jgi:hypothetical protein